MRVGFRMVERFSPEDGEKWERYVSWSGLAHLREVVGLDRSLCPSVHAVSTAEVWDHLVFAEQLSGCFDDERYALRGARLPFDARKHQLLALLREPTEEEVAAAVVPGYGFLGFELIEEATLTSALTNCGEFDGAFGPEELSECGLVPQAGRAYEIRRALVERFPDEPHADCAVWGVWRREAVPAGSEEG